MLRSRVTACTRRKKCPLSVPKLLCQWSPSFPLDATPRDLLQSTRIHVQSTLRVTLRLFRRCLGGVVIGGGQPSPAADSCESCLADDDCTVTPFDRIATSTATCFRIATCRNENWIPANKDFALAAELMWIRSCGQAEFYDGLECEVLWAAPFRAKCEFGRCVAERGRARR